MSIAFARVSIHSRSKGHSAVAACAYRAGIKLYDERLGLTHDYSKRKDVIFSTVLLSEGSHPKFLEREFLWNQAELCEKRVDAQVSKDIVLALPKELDLPKQIALATRFAERHFVDKGLVADISIHDHGDGNPHAHILLPTRRLEHDKFSTHKARDLNPVFNNKKIMEKDYWGELWREFQNTYFQEQGLDLVVDFNHIISEKHTGKLRDVAHHYLQETQQLIKTARLELSSNPRTFLQQISQTHSVFTRKDIEKLVFKTFSASDTTQDYLAAVTTILTHPDVITLDKNIHGIDVYTTRQHYIEEQKMLKSVEKLHAQKNHISPKKLDTLIAKYTLNKEQQAALHYLADGQDISVLVGRAGAGKSYLLKPLKEHYESSGYALLGTSLSGKIAKELQTETGIPSFTIASLSHRLKNQSLSLSKQHVLIVDEAGMVDFNNMAYLIKTVEKAGAKIILVGDPDQLKPIHKGEIFKGIAERIGFVELKDIQRQQDPKDRDASLAMAQAQVDPAIQHYHDKGNVVFSDNREQAEMALINAWKKDLDEHATSLDEHIILASTRAAVDSLNLKAREALQERGIIKPQEYRYFREDGARPIMLAEGERILLRKNDAQLGLRNGDLATISAIRSLSLTAILDSGEKVIIPRGYKHIDYGYALTVHKAQGVTVDKASVLIDSHYWNRHLAYVATTRHKKQLQMYVDKTWNRDLATLTKALSRSDNKENALDWSSENVAVSHKQNSLIGRLKAAIVHFSKPAYFKEKAAARKASKALGKDVAMLMQKSSNLDAQFKKLEQEALLNHVMPFDLPQFKELYQRRLLRNEEAYHLYQQAKETIDKTYPVATLATIKECVTQHEHYALIHEIASLGHQLPREKVKQAMNIDLEKDYPHILDAAAKNSMNPVLLSRSIERLQKEKERILRLEDHPYFAKNSPEPKVVLEKESSKIDKDPNAISLALLEYVDKVKLQGKPNLLPLAKELTSFMLESSQCDQQFKKIPQEALLTSKNLIELPDYHEVYQKSLKCDEQATKLYQQKEELEQISLPNTMTTLKNYVDRYERYTIIEAITKGADEYSLPYQLGKEAARIDVVKDSAHIRYIAAKNNKSPKILCEEISMIQQHHTAGRFNELKFEHPILEKYQRLAEQRAKVRGYKGEQLDKALLVAAKVITKNKILMKALDRELPKVAARVTDRSQYHREQEREL